MLRVGCFCLRFLVIMAYDSMVFGLFCFFNIGILHFINQNGMCVYVCLHRWYTV
jgi:hypothetical protein